MQKSSIYASQRLIPAITRSLLVMIFFIYEVYYLNPILKELDMFISVPKMKCHKTAGVTLAMKNLVGITPLDEYKREDQHTSRTALHGPADFDTRLPRVIVDLNRARPVNLSVIDGIMTVEAGEAPWQSTMSPIKAGLLVAGRDPVAVDAVSMALMGFDPGAESKTQPFVRFENYLKIANDIGLGTNRLEEIRIFGTPIDQVKISFKPVP
jgi:uncharacterized protein (DUF362 family)